MNVAEERAALISAGYPDPQFWRTEYAPTDEDVARAIRGEGPPPGWTPRTMAEEAEALVRAGYPDPREGYRTGYIPTYEDHRRASRGEGPPPGWTFHSLSRVEMYRLLGGADPQALETLTRRDEARDPPVANSTPRPRSLLARITAWLRG